jgi:endonuclease VIII
VPDRRLGEGTRAEQPGHAGLPARRVVAVDERPRREERKVLGQRELDPKARALLPASHLVVDEPEDRTVQGVERQPERPPARTARERLPEDRHVGVVVPEQPPVDRLERRPDERRRRPCRCCSQSRMHTLQPMPEGDSIHRVAQRLQALVGEQLEVETPHPRARVTGVAGRLDGRRLLGVEAVGKNLLLRFEDGLVLRSHLRMKGRWQVLDRNGTTARRGTPWLVLRGESAEAILWHGPVLELDDTRIRRLGPDILADPPDLDGMLARMRRADQETAIGEAVLDQRLVSGIGNMWRAEALWRARVSPWAPLGEVSDAQLRSVLGEAAQLMRRSLDSGLRQRAVYRQAGRPCARCGTSITSRGQGDANRIAYWCPACQGGETPAAV